jgi:hypothetical protein
VSRAIRASGARRIELNVFRPAGAVDVAAVVQTRDPAAFIDRRLDGIIRALNLITPRRLDSYYVAVVDETRTVVFAYSAAETQGMFTFYVRPDLYGCADDLPIQNEVAPDGAPPCPA